MRREVRFDQVKLGHHFYFTDSCLPWRKLEIFKPDFLYGGGQPTYLNAVLYDNHYKFVESDHYVWIEMAAEEEEVIP